MSLSRDFFDEVFECVLQEEGEEENVCRYVSWSNHWVQALASFNMKNESVGNQYRIVKRDGYLDIQHDQVVFC